MSTEKKEVRREVKGDATTVYYDDGSTANFLAMWDPPGTTRMEIIKNKLAGREDVLDEILENAEKLAKNAEHG